MRFIRKMGYESFTDFKLDFKVPTIPTGEYHYGPELLSIKNFPSNLFDKLEELADLIVPAEKCLLRKFYPRNSADVYGRCYSWL